MYVNDNLGFVTILSRQNANNLSKMKKEHYVMFFGILQMEYG